MDCSTCRRSQSTKPILSPDIASPEDWAEEKRLEFDSKLSQGGIVEFREIFRCAGDGISFQHLLNHASNQKGRSAVCMAERKMAAMSSSASAV